MPSLHMSYHHYYLRHKPAILTSPNIEKDKPNLSQQDHSPATKPRRLLLVFLSC